VRRAARGADLVIALSQAIADDLGLDAVVIRPGVDLERFHPGGDPGRHALFLGAITPWKRPQLAIEATRRAGIPLVIAGDPAPSRRAIDAPTAHKVERMLEGVIGPRGTAPEATIPGYILAGKTGTAQKADAGGYSATKYVASFIGFAPARRPRLLVAVMVDEPRGEIFGGIVAAPAFQKIASFALPYLKIPPG